MAAGQGGWLRPALGLRLLLATAFQAGLHIPKSILAYEENSQGGGEMAQWLRALTALAEVPAFVRSDKPKLFRGLQIKYVRGSDPVLKLLDDNGNIAEELSILKWNTDSVEEFLSEKLQRI
ncbi:selenoprotein precursor [Cricetulus griseus]|nr:selenoprotein precursor [Cricetulus griseus]